MKGKLVVLLLFTFLTTLSASEVAHNADNIATLNVVFSSNVEGHIGFSEKRVTNSSPVVSKNTPLEIETTGSTIDLRSKPIYIYWQLFTTKKMKVSLTEYTQLQKIVDTDVTPETPAPDSLDWEMRITDDDRILTPSTIPPFLVYSDNDAGVEDTSKPRIGCIEVVFVIPESVMNSLGGGYANYNCTLTLLLESEE